MSSGDLGGLRPSPDRPRTWLHPDVAAWSAGLPMPPQARDVTGRGAVLRASCGGVRAIVKRYRRGGLLGRLLPDAFVSGARAEAEVRALQRLSAAGVSPRCLALQQDGAILRRLLVAVEEIEGARDLLRHAQDEGCSTGIARAAGAAIRAMHEAGVSHADLHAGNVLVRRDGAAWRAFVVDLDGARLHDGGVPARDRVTQVLRFCRSADKWTPTAGAAASVRSALVRAALPRDLVLPAWREALRRHRLRRALGRVPRPLPG